MIHLGPRMRRVVRYVGIAIVGLITFVFALQMTFPYDRIKDKLVEVLSTQYDVTIGGVERGWLPGRVYFKALSIRTRAAKADEQVTTFYIEKLEVDLGLLALLGRRASVDIDAKIGAGHITGNLSFGTSGMSIHVDGKDLPAASLPMRVALGLPMTGKIEFAFALDLPNEKNKAGRVVANWTKAEGSVEFGCPNGCSFGDGKTKLKPLLKNTRNQVMVGDGIDFGQVNIDSLLAKAEIKPTSDGKNQKLEVTKFEAKSKDGELHVDFSMVLAPELNDSVVTGCLRFKGSDALLKREPKTFAAIQTTGAELRGDGMFHIKLSDKFRDMKRLNLECGANTADEATPPPGPRGIRPNLTVQPEEQVRGVHAVGAAPTVAPPPPIEPAGDAGVAVTTPAATIKGNLTALPPPPPVENEGSGSAEPNPSAPPVEPSR